MSASVLEVSKATVCFGERTALIDADLRLRAGEMVGLIGPNGAGKTTLLRAAAGLQSLSAGRVQLEGRALQDWDRFEQGRRMAFMPQQRDLGWNLRARAVVELGRLPHRNSDAQRNAAAVDAAMRQCAVLNLAERPMLTLSGGERARVLLARALASEPIALLADEPTASLDPRYQIEVMERLRALADTGLGVLVVLHDLPLAAARMDRIVLMAAGRIVADDVASRALTLERVREVFGVEAIEGFEQERRFVLPWKLPTSVVSS